MLYLDHDFDGILNSISGIPQGRGQLGEVKGMSMDQACIESSLGHQRQRSMSCAAAFPANAKNGNVVAHKLSDIQVNRLMRKGC